MVKPEDQELYNYWAIRYDRLSGQLNRMEILYLITTRLRYGANLFEFMHFILSALKTDTGYYIDHNAIFNLYYTATKCGILGNPDILDNLENDLRNYAHSNNQGRYWDKLPDINCFDMYEVFEELFKLSRFEDLNPSRNETYKPHHPRVILFDEKDEQGNIIYY